MENETLKSVNETWKTIKKELLQAMAQYIPSKLTSSKTGAPWVNQELRGLLRKRNKLYQKMKKARADSDLHVRFRSLKSLVQKKLRRAYWDYLEGILNMDPTPDTYKPNTGTITKTFWSFIKAQKKDSSGISPLKQDGTLKSDPQDKAEILNNQYQSVFTDENMETLPTMGPSPFTPLAHIHITTAGVTKLLQGINPSKATGPDNIPGRILKECAQELAPAMRVLFQRSIDTGELPDDWLRANITPVFKKGHRYLAANYRPVSLTCICSKILEHIVVKQILTHFDSHNILVDCQHGFRSKRSCETQLTTFIQELYQSMHQGTRTDVAIMDFSKAFDKVPHQRLLLKLDHYGVRDQTLLWVKNFLGNRQQRVLVDGASSAWASVRSGVPQGTVLGPLLFLAYINDLPNYPESKIRLFADDCVLYRQINSIQDTVILQHDLDRLADWERTWQMEFNPQKCHTMHITRSTRSRIPCPTYSLRGNDLAAVDSATYLGVELDKDLSFVPHVNKICARANRTLGFLKRNIRTSSRTSKERVYRAMVRPTLEYASPVWDPHQQKIH